MVLIKVFGNEDEESRDTEVLIHSERQITSNVRDPVYTVAASPLSIEQEIQEEQIGVDPLQADLQLSCITPPRAVMRVESDEEDLADSLFFLKDPDVLNCHICTDPLTIPVYECDNGHAACASCWFKMGELCSDCHIRKGSRRCRPLENVLESIISACCYVGNGCTARVSYSEKLNHENFCIFTPICPCPRKYCNYEGKSNDLYNHFSSHHSRCSNLFLFNTAVPIVIRKSTKNMFFQETNEKMLFVLRNFVSVNEIIITVICVAPFFSTRAFKFGLSVTYFGRSIESRPYIVKNARWMDSVPHVGIRIPNDLCSIHGQYDMKLTIWDAQAC